MFKKLKNWWYGKCVLCDVALDKGYGSICVKFNAGTLDMKLCPKCIEELKDSRKKFNESL